jgi:hypothetical protein
MHLSRIDFLLWVAGFFGHVALLIVLGIRHRARIYPVFTALITLNVSKSVILFLVFYYGSKRTYFYTYLDFLILDLTLQLGVAYEMARHVFCPTEHWDKSVAHELIWLTITSLVSAVGLSFLAKPHTRLATQSAMIRFDLFSAVLLGALFVGFIAVSIRAGLPWRTHVGRISQGLALYAIADVAIESVRSCFGVPSTAEVYIALSQIRIAAYFGCLVYWIITLWRDAPAPRVFAPHMREQLITLQSKVEYDLEKLRSRRK